MRMSGLQFKKASISESKARHGVSCFKSIAVSPHGTIEPISQRSLALANPVNVDNANKNANPKIDTAAHRCQLDKLPAIVLPEKSATS